MWVHKGAISSRRTMAIEEWSHETGEKTIQSNGGSLTVGDKYASNYIAVHPFDRVEGLMTLKLQVNDNDATVYRTDDYILWIRSDCSISGGVASCSTNAGEKMVSFFVVVVIVFMTVSATCTNISEKCTTICISFLHSAAVAGYRGAFRPQPYI